MTVPLLAEGRVTGVLAAAAAEPDRFTMPTRNACSRSLTGSRFLSSGRRLAELERARRGRISFLAEASDLLAGTLDQDKTIALAAQLVVPRLATWCAVYLLGERSRWSRWSQRRAAPRVRMALRRGARGHAPRDARPDAAAAGALARGSAPRGHFPGCNGSELPNGRSRLRLPTPCGAARSSRVGGCSARSSSADPAVTGSRARPVEMVEDLGRRAALALDNARLYSQQLQTSRALQRSLLPPEVPQDAWRGSCGRVRRRR